MHWIGWEKMKLPKEVGRLGLEIYTPPTLQMLARQCWRLMFLNPYVLKYLEMYIEGYKFEGRDHLANH
jgi:hypothetical protein